MAAGSARCRGRSHLGAGAADLVLEAGARRASRPVGSADRPPAPRGRDQSRCHASVRTRRRPVPSCRRVRSPTLRHAVHGGACGVVGAVGAVEWDVGHRDRHAGRGSWRGCSRRCDRHVRQHPGAACGRATGCVVRGAARAGAVVGSGRVRACGRAVRAAGGDSGPGALAGAASAVPGDADVPEPRECRVHSRRPRRLGGRVRLRCSEVRSAGDGSRVRGRVRLCRCTHLRDGPVRRVDHAHLRRPVRANPPLGGHSSVGGRRRHRPAGRGRAVVGGGGVERDVAGGAGRNVGGSVRGAGGADAGCGCGGVRG
ncbi:hypothetical protein Br6_05242 [Rhodococcus sp. Br-6]|nr:hypothetical protein Br6_05242 [Rhodococcus sp. Br-6]